MEGQHGAITTVTFKLKESEVDLLAQGRERALFCYVYNCMAGTLTDAFETPFMCFWMDGERLETLRRAGAFYRQEGDTKLTLACQLRKPKHEFGHWYALVVNSDGGQVDGGYLGVVGGSGNPASDGADHYSVSGYLDYARRAAGANAGEE